MASPCLIPTRPLSFSAPSRRPLGNATFLSLRLSKTRLLRHMQGAHWGVLCRGTKLAAQRQAALRMSNTPPDPNRDPACFMFLLFVYADGSSQEYWEWQLSFSVSTLGTACLALGALCLALFRCLTREDEHSCDCDWDCDCECDCECGCDSCCCDCDGCSCNGCEERKGGSSPEYIKPAGYTNL